MNRSIVAAMLLLAVEVSAQEASWIEEGRRVAAAIPPKLLEMLTAEIARGGPAGAIAVCREKAPEMARSASSETGWSIRRVSLRNRNPNAVPDEWERAGLEAFDRRAAAGEAPAALEKFEIVSEHGRPVYRYMRALPTQPLCTSCHGAPDQLAPGVKERLQELYPGDRAVGYRPGDIRGAITIKKPQ